MWTLAYSQCSSSTPNMLDEVEFSDGCLALVMKKGEKNGVASYIPIPGISLIYTLRKSIASSMSITDKNT